MRGSGDYRLSKNYKHMEISAEVWCMMRPDTMEKRKNKLFSYFPKTLADGENITSAYRTKVKKTVADKKQKQCRKKETKKAKKEEKNEF